MVWRLRCRVSQDRVDLYVREHAGLLLRLRVTWEGQGDCVACWVDGGMPRGNGSGWGVCELGHAAHAVDDAYLNNQGGERRSGSALFSFV
jgi:hypothetical protein